MSKPNTTVETFRVVTADDRATGIVPQHFTVTLTIDPPIYDTAARAALIDDFKQLLKDQFDTPNVLGFEEWVELYDKICEEPHDEKK